MPISSITAMYDFGVYAICGAATKTYLDWKAEKQELKIVILAGIANSLFAVTVGSHLAALFVSRVPNWDDFGEVVAYLCGAVAINIVAGLVTVNWKDIITSKLTRND